MPNEAPSAGGPRGQTAPKLDDIDRGMLDELTADGRVSIRALADRLRISRANAYTRLERLLADGVITGFTATVDPHQAGLGTSAYVLLTVEQNSWRELADALRAIPYVEHIALVGGDFDLQLLVRAPDNTALRDIVLERIRAVAGVRATRTWLIFEESAGLGPQWNKR